MLSNESSSIHEPYKYDPATRTCTLRGIDAIPPEVFAMGDDIEVLDASFGQLSSLPDQFAELKNLRIAFLSHNNFEEIPNVLSACSSLEMVGFKSCKIERFDPEALPIGLRGLILTDNRIAGIPESIGRLTALQKLMLTGNAFSGVPASIGSLRNLQLLRLSLNQLSESPDIVFDLPRLAWYSDSGNDFSQSPVERAGTATISWQDLEVGDVIGESSKNTVYSGTLMGKPVAVKLFGAGVTTDGDPADEMDISLAAGNHPHLIGSIGRLVESPDGRIGFVMPQVPTEYTPLGKPPDFVTLTRDVFPAGTLFPPETVERIARCVASAMVHLAEQGIMHGDIYAHNVLSRQDGMSYLGDLGAASRYPSTAAGTLREKVDVRGFGYLLDDLLGHCPTSAGSKLDKLREACLSDTPSERPDFKTIYAELS